MTTEYMNLKLPVIGVTPENTWASLINNSLSTIDEHDHASSGKKLTNESFNIVSDLDISSNDITNIKHAIFVNTSIITKPNSLFVNQGDLYYQDINGTNIRLTASGSINVGGVGVITGMDATSSMVYSTSTKTFSLSQDAGIVAKLSTGSISIQHESIGTNAVSLGAKITNSGYSLYFDDDAPAANKILSFSSTSQMKYKSILGTTNQIVVTHNTNDISISLPTTISCTNITASGTIAANSLHGASLTIGSGVGSWNNSGELVSTNLTTTHVTAAGNVSASTVLATNASITGISCTNITASGTIAANSLSVSGSLRGASLTIGSGVGSWNNYGELVSTNLTTTHVTAAGNVSASTVLATNASITGISCTNITASAGVNANSVISNFVSANNGFTTDGGSNYIKTKIIRANLTITGSGNAYIAHGLDVTKIISIQGSITNLYGFGIGSIPNTTGFTGLFADATNIGIAANIGLVGNTYSFVFVITYTI